MNGADPLGWLAASLMLMTFASSDARCLRALALAANLAFIAYGTMASLTPVLTLHLVLVPINAWRLRQALRGAGAKVQPCSAIPAGPPADRASAGGGPQRVSGFIGAR